MIKPKKRQRRKSPSRRRAPLPKKMASVIIEWVERTLPHIPGVEWGARLKPNPESIGRLRDVMLVIAETTAEGRAELHRRQIKVHANSRLAPLRSSKAAKAKTVGQATKSLSIEALSARLELEEFKRRAEGNELTSVYLAVIDDGIDPKSLRSRIGDFRLPGRPKIGKALSKVSSLPPPFIEDGTIEHSHGTRCAFDACIVTRSFTLLDLAVNGSSADSRISDAIDAYRHLQSKRLHPLVVLNPWQTDEHDDALDAISPSDPDHVFNLELADLAESGADIVFSVPSIDVPRRDPRLLGPASHPDVLAVTAIEPGDAVFVRAAPGLGALTPRKPDVANYHRIQGFGPDTQLDLGTSAAAAVAAGVVAALRSLGCALSPSDLRAGILANALPLGDPLYYGAGRLAFSRLLPALCPP